VTTRQDFISLNDLYGYLLSFELHLDLHKSAVDVNISTANTAQRQTTPSQRNTRGNRNNFHAAVAVAEDLLNNSPHRVPLAKFVKNRVIPLLHAGTALIKTTRLILLL